MNFNVLLQEHEEIGSKSHFIEHILTWRVKKKGLQKFFMGKNTMVLPYPQLQISGWNFLAVPVCRSEADIQHMKFYSKCMYI